MKEEFGNRMKGYEKATKMWLTEKVPIIVRLDGKAFHTLTKKLKSFDLEFHQCMIETTKHLVWNIQGCVAAYTQSDEISLLLKDWNTPDTQQWFGGNLQKIVSVSASLTSATFNQILDYDYPSLKSRLVNPPALFDSRTFTLPFNEVSNYFIWRQCDCNRNAINSFLRQFYSQKQMNGVCKPEAIDLINTKHSSEWESLPNWVKNGVFVLLGEDDVELSTDILFQNRDLIEKYLPDVDLLSTTVNEV